ncbi:LytTR family DNA-binding domain-containing protein [Paucisalibacillus globulus]|uniref:LytTR family DNA-binding domain-containing protein n=1 Tax=Paucisalibacillus globulus TaxID=351095 RepID=UPI0020D0F003|nr:LytTR family DNA-binding domain-containing protein [Paucisalibacillus globulus]
MKMKVNIDIDDKHDETTITIQAKQWSEELEEIIQVLQKRKSKRLFGMENDQTVLLEPGDIDYIYAENRKVFAALSNLNIEIKMKLYEVEEILIPHDFMRFSKSVIGNLNHIQRFELSFNGNLCVYFHSGNKEYITRNNVAKVKEKLFMGGQTND